ncbi:MAG: hypothetical protein MI867_11000 [Pseudomonadales bacterium]|nr:hypothetical protein [Pseudomonadales bacterium]
MRFKPINDGREPPPQPRKSWLAPKERLRKVPFRDAGWQLSGLHLVASIDLDSTYFKNAALSTTQSVMASSVFKSNEPSFAISERDEH